MKKLEKKDYIYLGLLILFIIGYITYLLVQGKVFGSTIDWANQHIVLPEYFKTLFYSNGNLFPSLAINIGMGQNIYFLSYYGLYSPIVLLSYLLPFIPTYIYMPSASIISLIVSIIMLYKWILRKNNSNVAFLTTALFMLNAPFIYHFHRHIMFVIYMPFLIGALKSVDLYFEQKRPIPLILYTLLMILTNYYFSVFGILAIGAYTLYTLLKPKKFKVKSLISIIYFVLVGVLLAGFILMPTIHALTNGRIPTLQPNTSILNLLAPWNNINYTFYNNYYSWGITLIYLISIIHGLQAKERSKLFLNTVLAIFILFPLCNYVFNAFMYLDGKCFIPFIPVALLSVSEFIDDTFKNKIDIKKTIIYTLISTVIFTLFSIGKDSLYLFLAEGIFTSLALFLGTKYKKNYLIFIPTIIIALISFGLSANNESYITTTKLTELNDNAYYELTNIKDKNLYRTSIEDNKLLNPNKIYNASTLISSIYSSTSNPRYFNFARNIFELEILNRDNYTISQTSNVLFNIYSGTKYLIASNEPPIGYEKVKTINNITLYENNNVLPIGYASNKIMSKREFDLLSYPETIDAILNYIIIDTSLDNVYKSNIQKYNSKYKIYDINNVTYKEQDNHYFITADDNASFKINLNKKINNEVLIIKFKMNKAKEGYACSSNITINKITNALSCKDWKYYNNNETFEYVLSSNNTLDTLDVKLSKGKFDISDIEVYTIDYAKVKSINKNVDELVIDQINSSNDKIIGTINAKNSGYVKITIPYDDGFRLYLDGKRVAKVRTDDTFLGLQITAGKHEVRIEYEAPNLKTGIMISIIGTILLIITALYQKYQRLIKDK